MLSRVLSLIVLCIILLVSGEVFALPQYRKPTRDEVIKAAAPCKSTGSKMPINDTYTCPKGEFGVSNGQTLTDERIECAIQIALHFAAVDEVGKNWAKQLQNSREKDISKWNNTIDSALYFDTTSLSLQYGSVCQKSSYDISNFTTPSDATMKYGCALTSDVFPETTCQTIASQKIEAWGKAASILMSNNISKSFQNDKDTFMSKVKDNYDKLLDKLYRYKLMLGNAVSKFTGPFIEHSVK